MFDCKYNLKSTNKIMLRRKPIDWCHYSTLQGSAGLRLLGKKNKKKTGWSNDKTIIDLGYRKISWFVSVSQINYLLKPKAEANNWSACHWQITIFCSTSSNNCYYFLLYWLPRNNQGKWTCGVLSGSTLRELETPVKSSRVDKSQHGIVANNQTWIDFSKNLTHGAPLARFARLSSATQRSNVYACPNGYFFASRAPISRPKF